MFQDPIVLRSPTGNWDYGIPSLGKRREHKDVFSIPFATRIGVCKNLQLKKVVGTWWGNVPVMTFFITFVHSKKIKLPDYEKKVAWFLEESWQVSLRNQATFSFQSFLTLRRKLRTNMKYLYLQAVHLKHPEAAGPGRNPAASFV